MDLQGIDTLTAMGFSREQAIPTLIAANNDLTVAISLLVDQSQAHSARSTDTAGTILNTEKKKKNAMEYPPPPYDTSNVPPAYPVHSPPESHDFVDLLPADAQKVCSKLAEDSVAANINLKCPRYKAQQVDLPKYRPPPKEGNCAKCFNTIKSDEPSMTLTGQHLHLLCYAQRIAPKCSHCHDALVPDARKNRTGRWVPLDETLGNRVHEECYRLSGPRCVHCYDVIYQAPEKNRSGDWVYTDPPTNERKAHLECWHRFNRDNVLAR
ncbi:hypothetical protein SARC_01094 [Sphaeroforma arctica JP610]|uniref:UBA domain-containing protein n=1 Tax=Sphaeroforma arctica JP610 TaxID=667725 RepID=A0A0L0GCL6_9EUKA|nr:hypothetical protein SARC_01094 [Sphaeroforma arctica JP610]KNC86760.1 hypothetical protein SARC_01094 [Sphaeroforma arctica JP610]|eukprot:XP_014160662.1 hypothetical protein SARC_01094 [Sphaeroforma arctica JP610]